MAAAGAISVWISTSTPTKITASNSIPRICYPLKLSRNGIYRLSTFERNGQYEQNLTIKAAASSSGNNSTDSCNKFKSLCLTYY